MSEPRPDCLDIIACDLSFRRPGFAVLRYHMREHYISVLEKSNINNKSKNKFDGEVLLEIAREVRRLLVSYPMAVVVRERALDKQKSPLQSSRTIEVLHKVVGVTDLYAWAFRGIPFDEIPPQTVKKTITNDANAEKETVAASLVRFVGEQEYACDDESDAVAIGVTWLIQHEYIDSPYEPVGPAPKKTRKKKI